MKEQPGEFPNEVTLYRKYRPQALGDVLGQDHVVTVLRNALAEEKVSHAYLFAGPRGTGKTTVARILAKRLNCERPQGAEPCGTCSHCEASRQHADLDLIEIDAASNRGIDEIRALKERIRLAPTSGRYKVYIVDEVHMLTKEAFNALLKTLEEPPHHAIFILATTELQKVPDTIRSRCQTFLFRRAPVALVEQRLAHIANREGCDIEKEAVFLIASHSEGCFRDAESLLGQVLSVREGTITARDVEKLLGITGFEIVQTLVDHLIAKDARAALELVQMVADRGVSLRRFTEDVTRYLRALTSFSAAGIHGESFAPSVEAHLLTQAEHGDAGTFLWMLRLFLRAKTEMRDATYEELPFELAILEWCQPALPSSPTPPEKQQEKEESGAEQLRKPALAPATAEAREEHREKPSGSSPPPENNVALFEKVTSLWQPLLEESARLNPLLVSTLEACVPVAVRGNILYLVTSYPLYRDRISDKGVRTPLEDALGTLLGERLLLRVVHKNDTAALGLPEPQPRKSPVVRTAVPRGEKEAERSITSEALSIFGGELLEQPKS
jgi:DNA polymerase-3 subunit gamma/tau